jgi:membrane associated rhomboid family serine protease
VEEILVAIIQFLIEVIGQALVSVPFDFCPRRDNPGNDRVPLTVIALIIGCACGWASPALFPSSSLQNPAMRTASLVASPLLAGIIAYFVAKSRTRRNPLVVPRHQFWYASTFTLGVSAYRFTYAKH